MKLTELPKGSMWKIEKEEGIFQAENRAGIREKLEDVLDRAENTDAGPNAKSAGKSDAKSVGPFLLRHGDVVQISDRGGFRLLHDGSSPSGLIFVTNHCNSNCIMCPDSEKARMRPDSCQLERTLEYISLLPSDLLHLDITGGEPTLLKYDLITVLELLSETYTDTEKLMLTNGRSFADRAYAAEFGKFSGKNLRIEIPVHGETAELHDRIAGCTGSFEQTRAGIRNLLKNGIPVGIRIVVSRLNYQHLNEVIDWIAAEYPAIRYVNLMGLELLGNAYKNRETVWVEFDEVREPLQRALYRCLARGIEPRLFNYPLCLFERKYWYCYRNSITDYKIRYFEDCDACAEKGRCGGFFFSTFHHTTYKPRVIRE